MTAPGAAPVQAGTGEVRGRAVNILDGDTLVLLTDDRRRLTVRLASIDAPEGSHTDRHRGRVGQPFSANSRSFLQSLVKGRDVLARCVDLDRYDRSVCEIFVDGASVNVEMVKAGWAWANLASNGRYLRDRSLPSVQESARAARRGIWAGLHPVPPWEWRKRCWEMGDCPN